MAPETHVGMRWGVAGGVLLLAAALVGYPCASAAAAPPSGWAVLIEHNAFNGRYSDLPVAYINSTRMLTLLLHRGWPLDHILLVRDNLDPRLLRHAAGWLAARVHAGDTALLYVAGEYRFFDRDLSWDAAIPDLWKRLPTSRRVLIVETCHAERLTAAVRGIPGVALAAVGGDEVDWWGLRERDHLIRGGSFTYFLTQALGAQPNTGPIDFGAAFPEAVAGTQSYFRTVISTTPGALDAFHARGQYPERLTRFPNPRLSTSSAPDEVIAQATPEP
ncbi:MAG: hypothetical protein E6H03_00990 [Bacillati bacterium ANGP1]|uniref:Caspase family protein n=1 Tax=Candidatus Segetimicrobium genomatis TaxID=2569760 RepID=A0A537JP58_9BACT|nr:MAG: hypothetical protein E6H03_00990 [Terrabacteria group bacterium ANGP1]